MTTKKNSHDPTFEALEAEIGESLLYRTTGQLVSAAGLDDVPFGSWGLIVLTPTRLIFRHFAQNHPLFGGKDQQIEYEVPRAKFHACEARSQSFWAKFFSGAQDHVALLGPELHLAFESTEEPQSFLDAWNLPTP